MYIIYSRASSQGCCWVNIILCVVLAIIIFIAKLIVCEHKYIGYHIQCVSISTLVYLLIVARCSIATAARDVECTTLGPRKLLSICRSLLVAQLALSRLQNPAALFAVCIVEWHKYIGYHIYVVSNVLMLTHYLLYRFSSFVVQ